MRRPENRQIIWLSNYRLELIERDKAITSKEQRLTHQMMAKRLASHQSHIAAVLLERDRCVCALGITDPVVIHTRNTLAQIILPGSFAGLVISQLHSV